MAEPSTPLALDISLEQARALRRVWRALNDGACPNCRHHRAATEVIRQDGAIQCRCCDFRVTNAEIEAIESLFAPAMEGAMRIFFDWRKRREQSRVDTREA